MRKFVLTIIIVLFITAVSFSFAAEEEVVSTGTAHKELSSINIEDTLKELQVQSANEDNLKRRLIQVSLYEENNSSIVEGQGIGRYVPTVLKNSDVDYEASRVMPTPENGKLLSIAPERNFVLTFQVALGSLNLYSDLQINKNALSSNYSNPLDKIKTYTVGVKYDFAESVSAMLQWNIDKVSIDSSSEESTFGTGIGTGLVFNW